MDHNKNINLENLRKGIPYLLFVLDFVEPKFTQKFFNKIENSYHYATNGLYNTTDIYDVDFVENYGFSNTYGH